jgi:HPt (histidine-containing phosphotransfer) domain-containing protein
MPRVEYDTQALIKGYQAVALELGCNVWEFLFGIDTAKSYQAFVVYRDLGNRRSFDKLAIAINKKTAAFIKQIKSWSAKSFWVARASAYDQYIEKEARSKAEKIEISSHIDKLKRYRVESEILGWDNLEVASKCLSIAKKVLENYENNPDLLENMRSQDLRNIVAAGNACGEQSLRNLNEALDVARLLETLDNTITIQGEEIPQDIVLNDVNYG